MQWQQRHIPCFLMYKDEKQTLARSFPTRGMLSDSMTSCLPERETHTYTHQGHHQTLNLLFISKNTTANMIWCEVNCKLLESQPNRKKILIFRHTAFELATIFLAIFQVKCDRYHHKASVPSPEILK